MVCIIVIFIPSVSFVRRVFVKTALHGFSSQFFMFYCASWCSCCHWEKGEWCQWARLVATWKTPWNRNNNAPFLQKWCVSQQWPLLFIDHHVAFVCCISECNHSLEVDLLQHVLVFPSSQSSLLFHFSSVLCCAVICLFLTTLKNQEKQQSIFKWP